jgi:hypothetical protein
LIPISFVTPYKEEYKDKNTFLEKGTLSSAEPFFKVKLSRTAISREHYRNI